MYKESQSSVLTSTQNTNIFKMLYVVCKVLEMSDIKFIYGTNDKICLAIPHKRTASSILFKNIDDRSYPVFAVWAIIMKSFNIVYSWWLSFV